MCVIYDSEWKEKRHFSYITNHEVTKDNVVYLIEAGRAKWKIENENNTSTEKVIDSVTVYYRLPWVDKPEIKLVDGLSFLVKPTRNPIYRIIHAFHVIGLTLRNTCLKIGKFFRNNLLTWPFFSSYIWTFVVITILTFLMGLGILKIKGLIFRK